MKNPRSLPIPFLILLLAGVVSLFSILADRGSRASTVKNDSLQVQTVEQERIAETYFHILSWLSEITPQPAEPAQADPAPAQQAVKTTPCPAPRSRFELCTFHSGKNLATPQRRARSLN